MKHNKNKGFAMILVIFALILIGLYSAVLAGIISTMQHQSEQMLLDAKNFNLRQSGLAFVKSRGEINESIEIRLDDDLFRNCSIIITGDKNLITIKTTCSIGRQKKTNIYSIPVGK